MRDDGRTGRVAGLSLGVATGLVALASLGGCSSDEPAVTVEQKQSADAKAPQSASADKRAQFLPLLRKYHDQLTWPPGRDRTPEEMWEAIAPQASQLVLDDAVAQGDVGFDNLCAWALTAIDTVKAAKDTTEVRKGLLQSQKLMPGGEAFSQSMADELVLGNIEKTQKFVTANKCDDSS